MNEHEHSEDDEMHAGHGFWTGARCYVPVT